MAAGDLKNQYVMDPQSLTQKQKLFVEHVLAGKSDRQAAKAAGYLQWGVEGPRLRRNPVVMKHLGDRVAEAAMEADEVLQRLADVARNPVPEYLKINGVTELDLKKLKGDGLSHVLKIKVTPDGLLIETLDPMAALDKLGRHLGLWDNKLVDVNINEFSGLSDEQLEQIAATGRVGDSGEGAAGTGAEEA